MTPIYLAWIPLMSIVCVALAGQSSSPPTPDRSRPYAAIQGPPASPEPRDPAYRQYWSDGCRREREFGYTQSPNCQHPAYSGRGSDRDWGRRRPHGPPTVIINRGGTVVVPQGGHRAPSHRSGSMGGWGR